MDSEVLKMIETPAADARGLGIAVYYSSLKATRRITSATLIRESIPPVNREAAFIEEISKIRSTDCIRPNPDRRPEPPQAPSLLQTAYVTAFSSLPEATTAKLSVQNTHLSHDDALSESAETKVTPKLHDTYR